MLNKNEHYVAWAMLMYQLSDARNHLDALVSQMSSAGSIDEEDFAVQLGHVYAHLNRAWNCRNNSKLEDVPDDQASRFPVDPTPVG